MRSKQIKKIYGKSKRFQLDYKNKKIENVKKSYIMEIMLKT